MLDSLTSLQGRFTVGRTLDERVDQAFEIARKLGFTALIYDYAPVSLDTDGQIITPSLLRTRNIPTSMAEYWCNLGYYQIDPVQQLALRSTLPFIWSYRPETETLLGRILTEEHKPVIRYVFESGIVAGVTVPIHMPDGDYATFTGIRIDERGAARDAEAILSDFTLLAHVFHDAAFQVFDQDARTCTKVRLTDRERECLRYTADGLSAKEISQRIDRSVPTVVMHLNAAARKLGARNRVQAVVRATHYRLLD
jgi:LuxR family transcriptional regulator